MLSEYDIMAKDFLRKSNTTMTIAFKCESSNYFGKHDGIRNVYTVTLKRDHKCYRFEFGDSIFNYLHNRRPSQYDVLSCLMTYPVSSDMWDFADEFGYDVHDRESYKRCEKVHKACLKQYAKLQRLFGDELLNELSEIS